MNQKTFEGMPTRPDPVFTDVIDRVTERIARELDSEPANGLIVSREEAENEIAFWLMVAVGNIAGNVEDSHRKRCEWAVKHILSISRYGVGNFEITEYFVRVVDEELEKLRTKTNAC